MTTPDETQEVDTPNETITPRVRGKFALFDTPDGGLHVAYRPDGQDTDQHFQVPGHILKMAKLLSEGKINPIEMLKQLRGE